ncbi:MAG: DUF2325 domain-containing protein [Pseudomonas sp.]
MNIDEPFDAPAPPDPALPCPAAGWGAGGAAGPAPAPAACITREFEQLALEHRALMREHGRAQLRCTELLRLQARELERLQAQAIRLRAQVIVRETALAWAREDRDALERAIPGLRRCMTLSHPDDSEALEASLRKADLVICQAGCLTHGAYWRVQDHCRRTGKTCVLVEQPEALRIVRIHQAAPGPGRTVVATSHEERA